MNTWIEMINGPIGSEMIQLELLWQEVIVSLLYVIVYANLILFSIAWLLAAVDCVFAKGRDMTESQNQNKTGKRHHGLSGSKFSQAAARLSRNNTVVAAGI
jgi:hypothetical protein